MPKVCLFENGGLKFLEAEECKIAANDSGANFGDGVYEVVAVIGNDFVDLAPHMDRLKNSLAGVEIELPKSFGLKHIEQALIQLLSENELGENDEGYVYLRITRGVSASRDFKIAETMPGFYAEWHPVKLYKNQQLNEGETLMALPDTRWFFRNLKTLQLMPARLAKRMGEKVGAQDIIFINANGVVTEGGSTNLFIVKNGEIFTHPADNAILAGITRMRLIELARANGYKVREQKFTLSDLLESDEVFRSSTSLGAKGVTKVIIKSLEQKILGDADLWRPAKNQVGEHKINNGLVGPITLELNAKYSNYARKIEGKTSQITLPNRTDSLAVSSAQ